jgi:hypothetical protein
LNNPDGEKIIQVVLAGKELPSSTIEQIRTKLPEYKLDDVELEVLQGIKGGDINPSHIHSMMMYPREKGLTKYTSPSKNAEQSVELNKFIENQSLSQQLLPEVKLLFPNVLSIKIGSLYQQEDSSKGMDTLKMAVVHFEKKVSDKDKTKLNAWLKVRTKEHKNYSLIEK